MSEFINTADVIGDDEMCDQLIMRTVTEYRENRVSSIRRNCFHGCVSLTVVDLPNISEIPMGAFGNCTALAALILRNGAVCTLDATNWNLPFNASSIAQGTGYVYVPKTLVDSYKGATNWSVYAAQIRAIEDYPEITGG